MEPLIAISTINDFLYCPRSLYMHIAAGDITPASYHDTPQIRGNELHSAIEEGRYSHRKNIWQATPIYSEELQLYGKLDTYDTATRELVERKAHLTRIYEGYLMQLYAEYYCLIEMGETPKKLAFYSMLDNKKYPVPLPSNEDKQRLLSILDNMRSYTPEKLLEHHCSHCDNNIYAPLSW